MKQYPSHPVPADMQLAGAFADRLLSNPSRFPLSYWLDETPVHGFPEANADVRTVREADTFIDYQMDVESGGLSFCIVLRVYNHHPVVEWSTRISNRTQKDSPLFSKLFSFDGAVDGTDAHLWYYNGDFYNREGYREFKIGLCPFPFETGPKTGRTSDAAFPYFRLQFEQHCACVALGWPTQWVARFSSNGQQAMVQAGQRTLATVIKPGETLVAPDVTLVFSEGDADRSIQIWRKFYMAHIMVRENGEVLPPKLMLSGAPRADMSVDQTNWDITDPTYVERLSTHYQYIEFYKKNGITADIWWLDTAWHCCARDKEGIPRWWGVGTWEFDPERFPGGFTKAAHDVKQSVGADFLLWFEPERVYKGTKLYSEHPEWMLAIKEYLPMLQMYDLAPDWGAKVYDHYDYDSYLLDIGNDACRQYYTDMIHDVLKENHVTVYRQDFNFDPLPYWRQNESANRRGMLENQFARGYWNHYREILERLPGVWIDSCSSGGRRNDLTTMKMSVPLHYSDYGYGELEVKTGFHRTMFEWLPYFKDTALAWDDYTPPAGSLHNVDHFAFLCALAPAFYSDVNKTMPQCDVEEIKRLIPIWRRAAGYMYDDYHMLLEWSNSSEFWAAWQFNAPDKGTGMVQVMRHRNAPKNAVQLELVNLSSGRYEFEDAMSGKTFILSTDDLDRSGLVVELEKRSGVLLFYRKVA